jgi:hypothetical protein
LVRRCGGGLRTEEMGRREMRSPYPDHQHHYQQRSQEEDCREAMTGEVLAGCSLAVPVRPGWVGVGLVLGVASSQLRGQPIEL